MLLHDETSRRTISEVQIAAIMETQEAGPSAFFVKAVKKYHNYSRLEIPSKKHKHFKETRITKIHTVCVLVPHAFLQSYAPTCKLKTPQNIFVTPEEFGSFLRK